jgi:hypothetical protein
MYRTIISSIFLHGCETCFRAFSNGNGKGKFEKTMLRTIFGTEVEEVIGGRRNAHNAKLHDLCSSPNITTVNKLRAKGNGQVECIGRNRNA